jgi:hypothetical protein
MRRRARAAHFLLVASITLGLPSCGGASGGGGDDSHVLDIPADSIQFIDRCSGWLEGASQYPGHWERTASEFADFQRLNDAFRDHYGSTGALYSVQPKDATVSPDISLLEADATVIGIQFAQGGLSVEQMEAGTNEFVTLWQKLLNPYGVDLIAREVTQDRDLYLQRDFDQSYCGLELRFGDQHEYTGRLHFTAYRSSGTLLFAYSSLVPIVPLPRAVLRSDEVQTALINEQLVPRCGDPEVVTDSACFISPIRQVVFVSPIADRIELRIAYEAELRTRGCGASGSAWTVVVDAIDGALIHANSDQVCLDY